MNAVIDTNILIDYLSGSEKAKRELDAFEELHVSLVTWMEILVGAEEGGEESEIREFLRRFRVQPIDEGIAERAVSIRRRVKLRLPDAIIWATAQQLGLLLVTRNTRDFQPETRGYGFRTVSEYSDSDRLGDLKRKPGQWRQWRVVSVLSYRCPFTREGPVCTGLCSPMCPVCTG